MSFKGFSFSYGFISAWKFFINICLPHYKIMSGYYANYDVTFYNKKTDFWITIVHNQITNKEPKSDDCLSKFDWLDLSPTILAIMLLSNLKVFSNELHTKDIEYIQYLDSLLYKFLLLWCIILNAKTFSWPFFIAKP